MSGIELHTALLEQLQENEAKNTAMFRASGYTGALRQARCKTCGIYESIVFWTPIEGDGLLFSCPSGCKTQIRYELNGEETEKTSERRRSVFGEWVLLPIVYAVVAYLAVAPQGQALATQLWATSQAQIATLAGRDLLGASGQVEGAAATAPDGRTGANTD